MKTRTGEEFSVKRPDCAPTPHEVDGVGVGRKLSEKKKRFRRFWNGAPQNLHEPSLYVCVYIYIYIFIYLFIYLFILYCICCFLWIVKQTVRR